MHIHAFTRTARTPIELFGIELAFEPNAKGHVVAEVTDERAIERLLSISEAYREYDAGTAAVPAAAPVAPAPAPTPAPVAPPAVETDPLPEEPKGHSSGDFPVAFEIAEGKSVTIAEIVAAAQARSGLDVEEWNLNDEEDRDALIETEIKTAIQAEQAKAEAAAGEQDQAAVVNPLVLRAEDGTTVDLSTMSAKDVRTFAAENGVELPGGNSTKVADLRLMVAEALTKKA